MPVRQFLALYDGNPSSLNFKCAHCHSEFDFLEFIEEYDLDFCYVVGFDVFGDEENQLLNIVFKSSEVVIDESIKQTW